MSQSVVSGAALAAVLGTFLSFTPAQTTHQETEPNDQKSQANGPFVLQPTDLISGRSSVANDSDYWLLQTEPLPAGIYEHRLAPVNGISGTPSDLFLHGLRQTNGVIDPASDLPIQAGRYGFLRWYGFGRSEQLYVRKFGSAFEFYTFQYTRQPVTPERLPRVLEAGPIRIETTGSVPADFWIYDSELRPLGGYGNDDGPGTSESVLTRTYSFEPGVYYLAVTIGNDPTVRANLANELPSPPDDAFRNGPVLEFSDAIACAESANQLMPILNVQFTHGDPARTVQFSTQSGGSARAHFVQFQVVPQNALPSLLARGSTTFVQQGATTPDVAVTGQDLYMAYGFDLTGLNVIGFRHSPDRGQNFTGPTTSIPGSTNGIAPDIEADGNNVAVGYARVTGTGVDVEVAASADSGNSWGVTTLTSGGFALGSPDLALGLNGALSVLYKRSLSAAQHEIVYQASNDYGMTFGAPTPVSPAGVEASDPSIARRGDFVFATWTRIRPNPGIQGRYSLDGGNSWLPVIDLAPILGAGGNAQPEAAIAENGTVGVTFVDIGAGHTREDVYFMQSTGSASFSMPVCASRTPNSTSLFPSITAQGRIYHITWTEDDNGTLRARHSTVAVDSRVPPSLPVTFDNTPGVATLFARAAAFFDALAFVYAHGSTQTDVVLYALSGSPTHVTTGNGGCGGGSSVPVCAVRGDLGTGFELIFGPGTPNSIAILGIASGLAATPMPLSGGCGIEIDLASAITAGVLTDAIGNYRLRVPFALPGTAFVQAGFLGGQQMSIPLTYPVGLY